MRVCLCVLIQSANSGLCKSGSQVWSCPLIDNAAAVTFFPLSGGKKKIPNFALWYLFLILMDRVKRSNISLTADHSIHSHSSIKLSGVEYVF